MTDRLKELETLHAAVAIANARLYEAEPELNEKLSEALLR